MATLLIVGLNVHPLSTAATTDFSASQQSRLWAADPAIYAVILTALIPNQLMPSAAPAFNLSNDAQSFEIIVVHYQDGCRASLDDSAVDAEISKITVAM